VPHTPPATPVPEPTPTAPTQPTTTTPSNQIVASQPVTPKKPATLPSQEAGGMNDSNVKPDDFGHNGNGNGHGGCGDDQGQGDDNQGDGGDDQGEQKKQPPGHSSVFQTRREKSRGYLPKPQGSPSPHGD
jgi:hypothetical protein